MDTRGGLNYADRIIADLADGAWHCSREWMVQYMPSYSQRISEINADMTRAHGRPRIESRPCNRYEHRHRSPLYEYRDVTAAQGRLF